VVGVVTSGYVTKIAVNPFYPPFTKPPPLLHANCTALSFIEPELLPIEVLHCGNREFRVFLRKIMENIIFPICLAKLVQLTPIHIFWSTIDCSSLHAAAFKLLFYAESVCGHFGSRDKVGGQTIRSAIAENPKVCMWGEVSDLVIPVKFNVNRCRGF